MNTKKRLLIIIIVVLILIIGIGITYALFSYNGTGVNNSKLVTGDIYMKYNESNQLTFNNATPTSNYVNGKYFEWTVEGKNESEKDIWYEIILNHGDDHETRTERLDDKFLRFTLLETKNNVTRTVLDSVSYSSINNRRIWVDTIDRNTTTDTVHTYRLYVWIDEDVYIGNLPGTDYDFDTWNDEVYASVKVNVQGDLTEKTIQDTMCIFPKASGTLTLKQNLTESDVRKCVNYFENTNVLNGATFAQVAAGSDLDSFCRGNGTIDLSALDPNMSSIDLVTFSNYVFLPPQLFSYGILNGNPGSFELVWTYNDSCGPNAYIPDTIIGYPITSITTEPFNNDNSFNVTRLTSVRIGNNIETIGELAFYANQLTSVEIPNSVQTIGIHAFTGNQLISVTIGNGITSIGLNAFSSNSNLTSIKIDKACSYITGMENYPFGAGNNVTIYGSNDEVCNGL